jgi:ankyrin repeat protein
MDHGADRLSQNNPKNSPLMVACLNGNLPIMKLLLELALNEEE